MDLSDLTVLDFTHLLPGPYATQLLADAGADVIKVEPPGGDPARHLAFGDGSGGTDRVPPGTLFPLLNRGKRSLVLDLKAEGVERALVPLFDSADVVIEQSRPGVADRLGIGEADVREHAPDVVYCSLTGYGQTGPWADRVGHDLNYVGEAGLLDATRASPDDPPVIPGVPVADMAGGLVAAFSTVSALLSRELGTTSGEYVDVSLTDAALSMEQVFAASALFGGTPRAGDTPLTGGQPCYDVYECADGRYLTVAALEPKFWAALCERLDHDELRDEHLATDPATREAVRNTLAETFGSRPREAWLEVFDDGEIPVGPVRSVAEAMAAPAFRDRGAVREGGEGLHPRLGFPAAGEVTAEMAPPPEPGADTDAILAEAGLDRSVRDSLAEKGVFGG
ncbi:MAG: CaiB/BaiF CoA-transferase family protein [Haloarculaceae archaeon]